MGFQPVMLLAGLPHLFHLIPSFTSQFAILSGSGNIEGIQIFFPLGLHYSHLNDRCLNMLTLPIHSTALGCNFSCVSYDLNKGWNTFINKIDSVICRFNVNVQMKSKKTDMMLCKGLRKNITENHIEINLMFTSMP